MQQIYLDSSNGYSEIHVNYEELLNFLILSFILWILKIY